MPCGCGNSVTARNPLTMPRHSGVQWVVYDRSGREVAVYSVKYEAQTHASKFGFPPPIPRT